jgi:hypothetical protein
MANFRLLPSGNWNAQVRVKGKSPQSKTFSIKAEGQARPKAESLRKYTRTFHSDCT